MSDLTQYLKYLSFFVWFGFLIVVCMYWVRGLYETAAMIKVFSIILAIGGGVAVFSYFFQGSSGQEERSWLNMFQCSTTIDSGSVVECGGWPIFYDKLVPLAKNISSIINYLFSFSISYAQYVVGIFILTKFSKNIWTVDPIQIFFAFTGGAILYVSATQIDHLSEASMNITQFLIGFKSHHGSGSNVVVQVMDNLTKWKEILQEMISVNVDKGIFSSIENMPSSFSLYICYGIIQIPLIWFSILNIFMFISQQFMLITIPMDVIKSCITLQLDSLIIIKKILLFSMLSLAIVTEYMMLAWFPDPSTIVESGKTIGFMNVFIVSLIAIFIVVSCTFISTVMVLKSFSEGKKSFLQSAG